MPTTPDFPIHKDILLHNPMKLSKLGRLTGYIITIWSSAHIREIPRMFFIAKRSSGKSCAMFSFHVSSVSFSVEQPCSPFSWSSWPWHFGRVQAIHFVECPSIWFSLPFPHDRVLMMQLWQDYQRRSVSSSCIWLRGNRISICPLT